MPSLFAPIAPNVQGRLDVGDGHQVSWETSGNPQGEPAVVVHGGPGSGCTPWHRRLFDPDRFLVVLLDQRGCGRSTPHASEADADLSTNTTQHLVADLERLRVHLGIERWMILGGSWGSTLALASAEAHPDRVTRMVLWGITTGRVSECDWLFRGGVSPLFPDEWERLRAGAGGPPDDEVVDAYARLLHDPDPGVRRRAAIEWCTWESATSSSPPPGRLDERFEDPEFALGFARLVTHYVRHDLFLEEGVLLRHADRLASIRGVLVQGRLDLQAPLGNAVTLGRAWPAAELVVVDGEGHAGNAPGILHALLRSIND